VPKERLSGTISPRKKRWNDMNINRHEREEPSITVLRNGPYRVEGVEDIKNSDGQNLPHQAITMLCRCGASKRKPFCDGSHTKTGFVGERDPNRAKGETNEYAGKEITIVDNTDVCCRDRSCITGLPQVFETCDPDAASMEDIMQTIRKCPSGALTYKIGGTHCHDFGREPGIVVTKNGPLKVVGGISLRDETGARPACEEHYTLCRCGGSKNKPFCDGTHAETDFRGDST
jgi:CDGSH-type Zn-finger protein